MPANLYVDSSMKGNEGRCAYIITKNNQTKGFDSNLKYSQIKMARTPIIDIRVDNLTIIDLELRGVVVALLHSFKLHPDEKYFTVHTDSTEAIARMNSPWHMVQKTGLHKDVQRIQSYIEKSGRDINIKMKHVKAHQDTLSTTPHKMNFVCDLMASVVNKI